MATYSVAIVRALLLARPALTAFMTPSPEKRVSAGPIPDGVGLPALGITEVSSVDRVALAGTSSTLVTSIVQVTVAAANYRQGKEVLAQVKYALRNFVGVAPTNPPTPGVTCHLEGTGPDFESPSGFVVQTQDVIVTFTDSP